MPVPGHVPAKVRVCVWGGGKGGAGGGGASKRGDLLFKLCVNTQGPTFSQTDASLDLKPCFLMEEKGSCPEGLCGSPRNTCLK